MIFLKKQYPQNWLLQTSYFSRTNSWSWSWKQPLSGMKNITPEIYQSAKKYFFSFWSKEHACIYTKESITGVFVWPKNGPDSKTKFKKMFFLKNVVISLDHYPKDFKFSGYEGLIHNKICPRQSETKRICSWLQWVLISNMSHFMLILDTKISV